MKRIAYMLLCLCLTVCCVVSCTQNEDKDNTDFTKITFYKYRSEEYSVPANKEEFAEYFDAHKYSFIKKTYDYVYFYVFCDKANEITNEELLSLNYSEFEKTYDENSVCIYLKIYFEDIDTEAILDLTENEEVKEIRFKAIS